MRKFKRGDFSRSFGRRTAWYAARPLVQGFAWLFGHLPDAVFIRANQIAIDAVISFFSLFLAYQLRFDGVVPAVHKLTMLEWMIALPLLRIVAMLLNRGYDTIWRYFNLQDAVSLAMNASLPTLILLGMRLIRTAAAPIGVIVPELLVFLTLAGGVRVLRRGLFELTTSSSGERQRAVLVGSDDTLAAALRQVGLSSDMEIMALLSPNGKLHGLKIAGFDVVDDPSAIARLLAQGVDLVLIADAKLGCVGDIVATCIEFGVEVRLLPSAGDVIRGDVRVMVRANPDILLAERALGSSVPHPSVIEAFHERVVLITGAGGSIGSELARQVAMLPVSAVVLLDHDENSIFHIHGELVSQHPSFNIVPIVGSVRDHAQLVTVFERYRPHVTLHAAAYKHVPIMEHNACEAVLNNVLGTREVLDLALEFGTERFLMVSTDKAVEPTSVMGATKRIAEMLVQTRAANRSSQDTRCACVRFGNVVGSRGSVIPTFLRQIAEGGPITITHEEMTRYLITIPEAVQLVLQASALGSDGSIYMLDMGDPVKITELARKLIEASGLNPHRDIEIRFVGARPGEKIHEQLWAEGAKVSATPFQRVLEVEAGCVPATFEAQISHLEQAAMNRDESQVLECLGTLPISFRARTDSISPSPIPTPNRTSTHAQAATA